MALKTFLLEVKYQPRDIHHDSGEEGSNEKQRQTLKYYN